VAGSVSAGIKVVSGNATLKIEGKINEETVTKNEIKNIAAGKEYAFSVLPGEVVNITVTSQNGNNVEIIAHQSGRERKFTVQGTDKTGLFVAFQNIVQ
jgi:flagellar hook assembly protein FlgD